jgi:hypothetical protein
MNEELRRLIFKAIDKSIDADEFETLQDAIENDDDVRDEYLRAVHLCENLSDLATAAYSDRQEVEPSVVATPVSIQDSDPGSGRWSEGSTFVERSRSLDRIGIRPAGLLAVAALLLGLMGGTAFMVGRYGTRPGEALVVEVPVEEPSDAGESDRQASDPEASDPEASEDAERTIAGHASLRRAVDLKWSVSQSGYREGDVLPKGLLDIAGGVAEIDFFSGATLMVEGPAKLDLESDWSVRVISGRLRASVPPAARGFIVRAADSEIVDLGTEFAVEVGENQAQVEVIDGEVKLVGGAHDGSHLLTGERRTLAGSDVDNPWLADLSTIGDLQRRRAEAMLGRFEDWKAYSHQLRKDGRLIAYYPIVEKQEQRRVVDVASSDGSQDGTLVGLVGRVQGRFGMQSSGLEFDRPGSRVRVRIDGEFSAYTFSCWVRIDSLDHRYNALFMGDGYENGEPHWQIRDDGCLMLSVMVDDTQDIRHFNKIDKTMVKGAGLHKVYYSEPIWDVSKSGQWFHLAAAYDPLNRRVTQYANGQLVASDEIEDRFFIDQLRIGPAEIGNWGQPFRETPWFAVRNMNGTIDEMMVFDAALDANEIESIYEQGKPIGY